ncbi:uncharacterized protein LOC135713348 [Ochlerotatus camptorhynchus]|uniref:uncharacterized protein LOC135713348 n=1 Tax=Ochlerotatus camptorhynchus TaxID=644619 RepID=UPI0031E045EA
MTLREKTAPEIPTHRKYSVSHSGRFKSRPKIRPSLSGDLFQPDALETTNNNMDNDYRNEEAEPKQSPNGPSHRVVDQVDVSGDTSSGNPQQVHQPHLQHHHSNRQQRSSREILETSL